MSKAKGGEWVSRANFGLHTGYIGRLTTKIIYFVLSVICATWLPITGVDVWWGKRRKKNRI